MKKIIKKILIIVGIIIGIILLDSIIALYFDTSPFIRIRDYAGGGTVIYIDKGILVDTYCVTNGIKDTVIKGFSYSLDYDPNITIVDKTKSIEDFTADTALEPFYEDDDYIYSYPSIISDYIIVRYSDGTEETVKEALKNNRIEIGYLDKFNIHYIKQEKTQVEIQSPPDLFVYLDGQTTKTKAALGTHSWKIMKDGKEEFIMADSLHPSQMQYSNINTLELNAEKINIESENADISSVNIYHIDKTGKIKKISFDNKTIMLGDLSKGEYALEIIANYSQGTVYYGIKIIVK